MIIVQREISLAPCSRGFHLATNEVLSRLPEIAKIRAGVLHLFIKHTSASLTLNENADPTVRSDMESFFSRLAPEWGQEFEHDLEGPDDMPAHVKASLLGSSVSLPITNGKLNLGTWQGIYLCEHRNHGGSRELVATMWGDER
jgi:secondary thiamine-phosphate synthase enzyme